MENRLHDIGLSLSLWGVKDKLNALCDLEGKKMVHVSVVLPWPSA